MKKIASAEVYFKFNIKSGLRHIGIKDEDRRKTTFVVPHEHYEWNAMSFGLKNVSSEFEHRMDEVYKPI